MIFGGLFGVNTCALWTHRIGGSLMGLGGQMGDKR